MDILLFVLVFLLGLFVGVTLFALYLPRMMARLDEAQLGRLAERVRRYKS